MLRGCTVKPQLIARKLAFDAPQFMANWFSTAFITDGFTPLAAQRKAFPGDCAGPARRPGNSPAQRSFTISRKLASLPSYTGIRKLDDEKTVLVTGNERPGTFSGRAVEGITTSGTPACGANLLVRRAG